MLPTKFGVNWPFGSGEGQKNRLSRWQPWLPSWIFDQNDFSCFNLLVTPMLPSRFKTISILFLEKKRKVDFQDSSHGGHLRFTIGKILVFFFFFFYLQVTPMLPTKFHVNWPFVSGEEAKNRFSRWWPWKPSWILDLNNFSYFALQDTPILPTKFQVNWPFHSGEEATNRFSR